jgi:von Willebrand factor type A domain
MQVGGTETLATTPGGTRATVATGPAHGVVTRPASRRGRTLGAVISLGLHLAVVGCLAAWSFATDPPDLSLAIESLFNDAERPPEEFTQALPEVTTPADRINLVAGGTPGGTATGGSGSAGVQVSEQAIAKSESLSDVVVVPNLDGPALPSGDRLGDELGSEQISGETGALVEGYGPALDRLTQELARLMRQSKVLVVWLFDESGSMRDDQADLRTRIGTVYEELKLFKGELVDDVLLSSVVSFGKDLHYQTPRKRPTSDQPTIMQAIDAIPVDKTGVESTCQAIEAVLDEYRAYAVSGKRKVVVVVVSDESGDDGERVEEVRRKAITMRAPIYVLGREAVFGYLYAHINWVHPQTGYTHRLPIRRGPETPFAEQLPFDGFRRRLDATMSGFGPYEQVRLARDTGGIFFQLPHEEQSLNDFDARKYAALDMKEYRPDVDSRRAYAEERDRSPFRRGIWEVIGLLNPFDAKNGELELPVEAWYARDVTAAREPVLGALARTRKTFAQLTLAERRLQALRGARGGEPSRRWRANYDLMLGQVMSYRVRLFQYGLALDQYLRSLPTRTFANPQSNQWAVSIGGDELLPPDPEQLRALQVTVEDLQTAKANALEQFRQVQREHPNTPWAGRAAWELTRGYGMRFVERYVPPPPPPSPTAPPPPPLEPVPNL